MQPSPTFAFFDKPEIIPPGVPNDSTVGTRYLSTGWTDGTYGQWDVWTGGSFWLTLLAEAMVVSFTLRST